MRAIMVMYDSLNRHYLPNYGCDLAKMPNFKRLGEKTVTFDRSYASSLPCMPARREPVSYTHLDVYKRQNTGWR